LKRLTYWTYSNKEISDLEDIFANLFESKDLYRDYENVWEWLEGNSEKYQSTINISREHNWVNGCFEKPLIIRLDFKSGIENNMKNEIGQILATEFNIKIYFGSIVALKNDLYEKKVDLTFEPIS